MTYAQLKQSALGFLLLACPSASAAGQSPDLAAFDKYVARAAQEWRVPGLAIAIVKDDSLVFAKGYGVLELGKPAAANEHTRFAIGSTAQTGTLGAGARPVGAR